MWVMISHTGHPKEKFLAQSLERGHIYLVVTCALVVSHSPSIFECTRQIEWFSVLANACRTPACSRPGNSFISEAHPPRQQLTVQEQPEQCDKGLKASTQTHSSPDNKSDWATLYVTMSECQQGVLLQVKAFSFSSNTIFGGFASRKRNCRDLRSMTFICPSNGFNVVAHCSL